MAEAGLSAATSGDKGLTGWDDNGPSKSTLHTAFQGYNNPSKVAPPPPLPTRTTAWRKQSLPPLLIMMTDRRPARTTVWLKQSQTPPCDNNDLTEVALFALPCGEKNKGMKEAAPPATLHGHNGNSSAETVLDSGSTPSTFKSNKNDQN